MPRYSLFTILFVVICGSATALETVKEPSNPSTDMDADVCVYGGTSGGVIAAIQAARMKKKVLLVEPGRHLGGMTASGLCAVDIGDPRSVGGVAREYFTRLAGIYGRTLNWGEPLKGVATGGAFAVEPHSAEKLFQEMAREAGITVLYEKQLRAAKKTGARITELSFSDGTSIRARVFIDATYEGDLMAAAGVTFTLQRESNETYGETLNGIQFQPHYQPKLEWGKPGPNGRRADGKGIWDRDIPIDPFVNKGDPASGALPFVTAEEIPPAGSASPGVQAYCYRLCLTRDEANRIPFTKPEGYDAKQYELITRFIEACSSAGDDMDLRWFSKYDPLPNGKYDFNTATFGGNLPGASWAWCEADAKDRVAIARQHENAHRGLFWFLMTDSRVPAKVRDELSQFGLCKDEFQDTGGWPFQIYVREGRRMVSDLVMTEAHCAGKNVAPHAIALASYGIDIHEIRRVIRNGQVVREGKLSGRVPKPYAIGYGAIVPKKSECDNLFVTFALSASHVAFGSIRMEPVFMMLSQSAASAANMAIDSDLPVQSVSYDALRARLLQDNQVLDWPPASRK
jgi:hypothetical protein